MKALPIKAILAAAGAPVGTTMARAYIYTDDGERVDERSFVSVGKAVHWALLRVKRVDEERPISAQRRFRAVVFSPSGKVVAQI